MNQDLSVSKRDGRKEPLDLDKIHRVIAWAADGLNNVSVSQVELKSHIQFYDGIRTEDIHETIIKAAADQISKDTPDYQYLAARLAVFHLRKKAYGQFEPPKLYDHMVRMVECHKYDAHLLADYTKDEIEQRFLTKFGGKLTGDLEISGKLTLNNDLEIESANIKEIQRESVSINET